MEALEFHFPHNEAAGGTKQAGNTFSTAEDTMSSVTKTRTLRSGAEFTQSSEGKKEKQVCQQNVSHSVVYIRHISVEF